MRAEDAKIAQIGADRGPHNKNQEYASTITKAASQNDEPNECKKETHDLRNRRCRAEVVMVWRQAGDKTIAAYLRLLSAIWSLLRT